MSGLQVGEKYLKIMIPFGEGKEFEFLAFLNKESTPENKQPQYRIRGGGAVWVNTKKAQEQPKVEAVSA